MMRFIIFIAFMIFNTNLYCAENHASEKANAPGNAPEYAVQQIDNKPKHISLPVDKTVAPVKRQVESTDTENQNGKETKSPDGWWHKFTGDPIAFFTGLLFAATLALFIATRQLVHGAENTSMQQLRAYVFPRIDENMSYESGWYRSVPLIIKNFGQTPAYSFACSLYIFFDKYPCVTKISHDSQLATSARSVIAPREHVRQYACLPDNLNQAEIDSVLKGAHAIFINGKVEYFDAFKMKHTTNICLYSTGADFSKGLLAYYHEGNNAD